MNVDSLRGLIFIGLLCLFVVMEYWLPQRKWSPQERFLPSVTNLLLVACGTLVIRIFIPVTLVSFANSYQSFGLLHQISLPFWLKVVVSVVLLDGIIYWQHRLFHQVPLLWRFHRMHHSDVAMGTTTAVRFHPVELLLSYCLKIACLIIVGVDAFSIVVFEIMLNGSSLWNHSNIKIPRWLDSMIRTLFVTPDMHRVHHSVHRHEHNSNYGFCLSFWDRLFMSYLQQPEDGHTTMAIGLHQFRQPSDQTVWGLLAQPFRSTKVRKK